MHHRPALCTTNLRCAPFCIFIINSVHDGAQYPVVSLAVFLFTVQGLCVFVGNQELFVVSFVQRSITFSLRFMHVIKISLWKEIRKCMDFKNKLEKKSYSKKSNL